MAQAGTVTGVPAAPAEQGSATGVMVWIALGIVDGVWGSTYLGVRGVVASGVPPHVGTARRDRVRRVGLDLPRDPRGGGVRDTADVRHGDPVPDRGDGAGGCARAAVRRTATAGDCPRAGRRGGGRAAVACLRQRC